MTPILRAIVSGLIGFVSSLSAVVAALPADVTLAQVPLSAWLLATVAGLTSLYAPNGVRLGAGSASSATNDTTGNGGDTP